PNNPTGYVPTKKESHDIVSLLQEKQRSLKKPIFVIVDDAYEPYVYTNESSTRSMFYDLHQLDEDVIPIKLDGFKGGFEKFQQSLVEQSKKNKEVWEENKDKVNKYLVDVKQDLEKKVNDWNVDMEKKKIESKEQWDAYKNKVSQDLKTWQEKTKQDWNDGVKTFKQGFFKVYWRFLVLTIPILIIVVIVLAVVNRFLG
ncbi:unnamed protein product, partial [marine sediment metagenome]